MKIREMIKILREIKDQEKEIKISIDSEGNDFKSIGKIFLLDCDPDGHKTEECFVIFPKW